MKWFSVRWFRAVAVCFLVLGTLLPAVADADPFFPPDFEGTGTVGQDPNNPLAIIGIVQNSLIPGHPVWYQVASDGSRPLAVAVDLNPANLPANAVQMHVDWQTPSGMPNVDWPGYFRVGDGTSSGLGPGVRYWKTDNSSPATYLVELIDTATVPVSYTIALTGSQFPPASMAPPPPVPFTTASIG